MNEIRKIQGPAQQALLGSGRIPGLDLIRGLAILLVIARHANGPFFGGAGIVGVVMFFALSGFLITGILEKDIVRHGRILYGRFYLHRVFRLIPALLFLLLVFTLVEGCYNLTDSRDMVFRSIVVAMTYVANIPRIGDCAPSLEHLWTLAVEEQFYLFWPLFITLAIKRGVCLQAIFSISLIIMACLTATIVIAWPLVGRVYSLPPSWSVSMVIGGAAFLYKDCLFRILKAGLPIYGSLSLLVLLALSLVPGAKGQAWFYLIGGPIVACMTVILIFWALKDRRLPFLLRPLAALGIISYAAYLWNYPLKIWLSAMHVTGDTYIVPIFTILMATASWFLVESPMRRLRLKIDANRDRANLASM
jgi:peptidoglycan/LPS O-acetylase OafA/YrhL